MNAPAIVLGEILDEFGVNEAVLAEKIGPMPEPPTPEQVSAALPERAVLFDLFVTRWGVVSRNTLPSSSAIGPVQSGSSSGPPHRLTWLPGTGGRLWSGERTARHMRSRSRDAWWARLASACEGASIVLLSPDGELNNVPWSALPDLAPGARPGACLSSVMLSPRSAP